MQTDENDYVHSVLAGAWPKWTDPDITLYHGTLEHFAEGICKRVDVTRGDPATDFGRGFYTTTWHDQAEEWAEKRASESPRLAYGAVVRLVIKRRVLSRLAALAFIRSTPDASAYWTFVLHCRDERPHRPSDHSYYDVVYGPVADIWSTEPPECRTFVGYDQISFHTRAAQNVLNGRSCRKEVLP